VESQLLETCYKPVDDLKENQQIVHQQIVIVILDFPL